MKKYLIIQAYFFIILFLLTPQCHAENNTTIDIVYQGISKKVLVWSDYLDKHISSWFDDNTSTNEVCLAENIVKNPSENIDSFFQNNKYLNETRDIYVRLRTNTYLYSRDSNKINFRLSAQLPFDRCKRQWKLFIQDPTSNKDEIKSTDTSAGGIGIRYYRKGNFGISASYSLGLRQLSPYIRARYKMPIKFKTWKIEPIQIFKYSSKYYFEEETNIYFDKYYKKNNLFRLQLHRKSASTLEGTDYGVIFQYYLNLGKDSGLELTQSFFGNTHYNNFYKTDKNYSGINNYVTSVSWRENIWRKWFYYEIRPSINFHKDHNYEASYSLRFLFDVYFGDYK